MLQHCFLIASWAALATKRKLCRSNRISAHRGARSEATEDQNVVALVEAECSGVLASRALQSYTSLCIYDCGKAVHLCVSIYMCIRLYLYLCTDLFICMSLYKYIYIYIYIYVCIYTYITCDHISYRRIYTDIYSQTSKC